jgi:serine/threonine-protein kinase
MTARTPQDSNLLRRDDPARRLWSLCRRGARPDIHTYVAGLGPLSPTRLAAVLRTDQRARWEAGERVLARAYLEQFPALGADSEAGLEVVYGEYLVREELEDGPDLEQYARDYPEFADRLRLQVILHGALTIAGDDPDGDTELSEAGRTWHRAGTLPKGTVLPGYEILEELGRGGMGVVFKARQVRLNRVVALKMILAGDLAGAEATERFLQEADVVARLQHPQIVQIHDFGEHEGRLYFALEYVPGGTLAQALDGTPRPPREAARLVESLARAIHAAHLQGIVHRDLKPANVLLAADGTPKIADFGLAKALDEDSSLTQTESIIGSPSYMAPEQAGGRGRLLGPVADVYSLGAIFYELLTGRPPFKAATLLETLEQARHELPVPPAQLVPKLPRDLETVCLKCLEKDPRRRYESAEALADDLKRYLEDRPIRARRVGILGRAGRWCRRNPAIAFLTAGVAASLLAGLAVAATQWRRAETNYRRELKANAALLVANARERAARRQVQERFATALGAVKDFEKVAEDPTIIDDPRLAAARERLLRTALAYYETLQGQLAGDADLATRIELAGATARGAYFLSEVGSKNESLAAYQRALGLYQPLVQSSPPDHVGVRVPYAETLDNTGILLRDLGRSEEAVALFERALATWEALGRGTVRPDNYRLAATWSLGNVAAIRFGLGHPEEALAAHRRALAIREELVRKHPNNLRCRSDRAWSLCDIGLALAGLGKPSEAIGVLEQSVAELDKVVRALPGHDDSARRLAEVLRHLGYWQSSMGRYAAARANMVRCRALEEALANKHPTSLRYARDLISGIAVIARLDWNEGRPEEALAGFRDTHKRSEAIIRVSSPSSRVRHEYAWVPDRIARLELQLDRPEAAIAALTERVDAWERTVRQEPEDFESRIDFSSALRVLGHTLVEIGALEQAVPRFEQSIAALDGALRIQPDDPRARRFQLEDLWSLVRCLRRLGRNTAAARAVERAEDLRRRLVAASSADSSARRALTLTLLNLVDNERRAEAERFLADARTVLEELAGLPPTAAGVPAREARLLERIVGDTKHADLRVSLKEYLYRATRLRVHLRQREAVASARLLAQVFPEYFIDRYNTACYLSHTVPLLTDPQARSQLADEAMATLLEAVRLGYRDAVHMRQDPDLDPLRARDDFRALMMDLAVPSTPFAK